MKDATGYFRVLEASDKDPFNLAFHCPACKCSHALNTRKHLQPYWDIIVVGGKVSVSPSLLVRSGNGNTICHLYIRDGVIDYLSDCTHKMAGKSVPLQLEEE